MDAWLITCENSDEPQRVAGLLPATFSPEEVSRIVETTYAHLTYTLREQADYLRDPDRIPYRAHIAETAPGYARIDCGHNPWLEARRVRALRVREAQGDERIDGDGRVEVITWEECTSSRTWRPQTVTQRRHALGLDVVGEADLPCDGRQR